MPTSLQKARSGRRRIRSNLEYPGTNSGAHGWEEAQVI